DVKARNTQVLTAYDGSIKNQDFDISEIDNGARIDYHIEKTSMTIPMTIVLDKDGVKVSILSKEIKEDDLTGSTGYALINLSLTEFFGAAGMQDDGYMIVPDGSGAIINYNNQRIVARKYSSTVYGADTSVSLLKRPAKTEQVYLPVLGSIIQVEDGTDHGFMAICESGDTCASVNAQVSEQSASSYNSCWFSFALRTTDTYYMGTRLLTVYEQGEIKQPTLTVGYYLLSDEELSYVDVADEYRDYLIEEKGLQSKKEDIKSSYHLNVFGGTVKAQSIAGFPINLETAATTYDQAEEIMKALAELGVDDIVLSYTDFNTAGIKGLISAGVDYSGTLGGKSAYNNLTSYIDSVNGQIYPSVGIMFMKDSGNGYSYSLNACKQTTKAYSTVNNWDIAFGIPHQVRLVTQTILSPYYWEDLFRKLREDFTREGIDTISLGEATTVLYSDFSRGVYTRADAMEEIIKGLQKFDEAGISVLADGANAYALPYVDYIKDVPLSSSNFDLFDYDIPFYSLVIHGYIPYTSTAINASANATDAILLSLATATPVNYDMMYTNPNKFTDSDYDTLFYSNYKGWLEPSANAYKLFKDHLSDLVDQKITDYKRVSADIIKTTYENGTTVTVDTKKLTLSIKGMTVSLAQYGLKGDN
ncbi:MAG: hypothetical protein IKT78_00730, partial [Ruminiclostridium sp.]|nr:hypothetical protein [Ruminiclostridium sp.]